MIDRKKNLLKLKHFKLEYDLDLIKNELNEYSYDLESPLVSFDELDLERLIYIMMENISSYSKFSEWANIIELRDDFELVGDIVKEFVFELASPEINGEISITRLNDYLKRIS